MKSCEKCGAENQDEALYCQKCGNGFEVEGAEDKYTLVYILCLIGMFLFLPLAVICGFYLWARPEPNVKRHGRNILLLCLAAFLFVIFTHQGLWWYL